MERIGSLIAWTPFLVGGFSLNILIALTATAIGTVAGALLCMMMLSARRLPQMAARGVCAFFRNIPTLVLVFYLATFIPNQIVVWDQHVIDLPKWITASIAFAASPLGFTAWNLHASILAWRSGRKSEALLFIPNLISGFMITLLASSTSSLVGVNEIVSRCNALIAANGMTNIIPVYMYAVLFFVLFCILTTSLAKFLKGHIVKRYGGT